MLSKDLTVIVTTLKSESKIYSCINSIPENIRVLVIENSENRKFKEDLESKYSNVECYLTGRNKGYAVANNLGLSKVVTKYALVLNPDTIVLNQSLNKFFETAKSIPEFWLIGPKQIYYKGHKLSESHLIEVENLKGFAIFFNMKKFSNNFFDENFFLYFEEIDLCKKVKKNNGKIYLDENISINHDGGSSVDKNFKVELEKNRNWHWMWSTFYFHKKYSGFIFALIKIFPKLISSFLKTIFYAIIFKHKYRDIYFCRLSGIFNSILGKKSWYRPSLD